MSQYPTKNDGEGGSPMFSSTELQQRIISELEEFREENCVAMMNTVMDIADGQEKLSVFAGAVKALVIADCVTIGMEKFSPRDIRVLTKEESLILLSSISNWCVFNSADHHWAFSGGDVNKDEIPTMYVTKSGYRMATQVLTDRGYQWWKPKGI